MHTVHCHVWIERQKINDVLKGVFSAKRDKIISEGVFLFSFKRVFLNDMSYITCKGYKAQNNY